VPEKIKILLSNSIFTGLSDRPISGAVAISGTSILCVGPKEIATLFPGAEILEYGDRTIMPSFHDAHVHLIVGAMSAKGGFLRDDNTEEAAAKHLFEMNKNGKASEWLLGGGWNQYRWPGANLPVKESLDKYFPARRVFLLNNECHGAWVNSRTLEYLGIDKDTPDPEFGEIFRDKEGSPSGYLHENAGYDALIRILDDIPEKQLGEYVKAFEKLAFSNGITAVSDMQVAGIMPYGLYEEMDRKNDLGIRVHYYAPFKWDTKKLLGLKNKHKSKFLQFGGTKEFVDGTPMGYTGLLCEPYCDRPGFCGSPAIDLKYLREKSCELEAAGIDIRLHCCGDGAVKESLDVFEKAKSFNEKAKSFNEKAKSFNEKAQNLNKKAQTPSKPPGQNLQRRHAIEHLENTRPVELHRFGELGVIASVQPEHLPRHDFYNHPFHTILGEDRMRWSWPFNSLQNAGARLAFGSDFSVVEINPMRGIFRAVTRLSDEFEPEGGFAPMEKLSLSDSLRAYTYGSAYLNKRENDLGTLESGKCADIVVLDCDIFDISPEDLINVKITATFLDGDVVYET